MIGRGTRLRPNLFGPGRHKEFFYIFDWCRNFEFFNQHPNVTEGATAETLAKRLFTARVELVGEVDRKHSDTAPAGGDASSGPDHTGDGKALRDGLVGELQNEVSGMSLSYAEKSVTA